jgi:hypothetical protein
MGLFARVRRRSHFEPTIVDREKKRILGQSNPDRVYRVQGGDSKERLLVTANGNIEILGCDTLFLNFNQEARALEFLARRGDQSYLVRFAVRNEFLEFLRETSIDEREARLYPDRPIRVDTQYPDQFGIRSNLFDELLEQVVSGSAEVIY